MTASLNTTIKCAISATQVGATVVGATPSVSIPALADISIPNGTTDGHADLLYYAERTLAASTSENLDVSGVLKDVYGTTLLMVKVRGLLVEADAANGALIKVGGAASNAFLGWFADATDILSLAAGDRVLLTSKTTGKTVTAATADILKVANTDAGAVGVYRIYILGTSA